MEQVMGGVRCLRSLTITDVPQLSPCGPVLDACGSSGGFSLAIDGCAAEG
jgi:hypothetical protein